MKRILTGAVLALLAASPARAERIEAEVLCEPTGARLEYRCIHMLEADGEAVENARFTVKPDMPSMPMAHNIAPVEATMLDEPGHYESVFTLDMHGRWSMRLDIAEPSRDVVIVHWDFEPAEGEDEAGHNHGAHAHD